VSFAVLAAFGSAGAAKAQWARQTTFDVGAIRLTRDDFADTGGLNVAALWSRWSDRVSLVASGAATRITDGRSTGIVLGSASYLVPLDRFRFEAGAVGNILGTSDQGPASSWVGFGRAHLVRDNMGAWIGGGGGTVHLEARDFGAATGDLGVWARRGEYRLTLSGSSVRTSMISTVIFTDGTVLRVREPVGYADASIVGHGAWGRFEVDALGLSRHAWKGSLASTPTAAVSAAWWARPNMAIAGAVGRQLSDPMRGTVRARYATVALRFSAERHGPVRPRATPPPTTAGAASIVAVAADGGAVVVRVNAPGAQRVDLMGDLTDWSPMPLERRGGQWEVRLTTTRGSHHVMLRIDGGAWVVPSNLPRIDDELGGSVGLLVIP
jgi:hypothetical protein